MLGAAGTELIQALFRSLGNREGVTAITGRALALLVLVAVLEAVKWYGRQADPASAWQFAAAVARGALIMLGYLAATAVFLRTLREFKLTLEKPGE